MCDTPGLITSLQENIVALEQNRKILQDTYLLLSARNPDDKESKNKSDNHKSRKPPFGPDSHLLSKLWSKSGKSIDAFGDLLLSEEEACAKEIQDLKKTLLAMVPTAEQRIQLSQLGRGEKVELTQIARDQAVELARLVKDERVEIKQITKDRKVRVTEETKEDKVRLAEIARDEKVQLARLAQQETIRLEELKVRLEELRVQEVQSREDMRKDVTMKYAQIEWEGEKAELGRLKELQELDARERRATMLLKHVEHMAIAASKEAAAERDISGAQTDASANTNINADAPLDKILGGIDKAVAFVKNTTAVLDLEPQEAAPSETPLTDEGVPGNAEGPGDKTSEASTAPEAPVAPEAPAVPEASKISKASVAP